MSTPSLITFLENKPLYYKEIDHLRVWHAYEKLKGEIDQPDTIHIVGTNGKGSTGRMMAYLAHVGKEVSPSLSVGHYSSPHILNFNERIWLNGSDADDDTLEDAHRRLFAILGQEMSEALSYFEYTTLLALLLFEQCDLIILEAGLGGEYDATNICNKKLSVITPIGVDHQAFLGDTIEEIAGTKIRSIQDLALLAPQTSPKVAEVAERISQEKGAKLFFAKKSLDPPVQRVLEEIAKRKGWPTFLLENAAVAIQALDLLDISYEIESLNTLELFGRFYALSKNIRIDVGHNPLAAKAIATTLKERVVLIYNSLDDKEYEEVLRLLKPKVKRVEIIPIASKRAATQERIEEALRRVGLKYRDFDGRIDPEENYLVFGSFYTVEAFLVKYGRHDIVK